MSVLVDCDIERAHKRGAIVIEPFDRKCLGTNSYDVHLADTLRVYDNEIEPGSRFGAAFQPLDVRVQRAVIDVLIPHEGYVLRPGELYLASTIEYTESNEHLPILNGKSSLGRLGLSIHVTAGTGDVGFQGHWTMELFVIKPLRVYAGMAVGQLLWFTPSGMPDVPYGMKPSAKYQGRGPMPQASKMHQEHTPAQSED